MPSTWREGITLEVRATKGSVENLALLSKGEVALALVQGGVDGGGSASALTSLGSVYYEPLWLFHRRDLVVKRLSDLAGARLAVGPQGSGTRAWPAGCWPTTASASRPIGPTWGRGRGRCAAGR